jgi:hypothetical protein
MDEIDEEKNKNNNDTKRKINQIVQINNSNKKLKLNNINNNIQNNIQPSHDSFHLNISNNTPYIDNDKNDDEIEMELDFPEEIGNQYDKLVDKDFFNGKFKIK